MKKFWRKKEHQVNVISDSGVVQKTDAFSLIVIVCSVVISSALIILGVWTLVVS